MSRTTYWRNFQTGRLVQRTTPDTDEDARIHIPNCSICQGLYLVCREQGDSILEAMLHVMNYHLFDHGERNRHGY